LLGFFIVQFLLGLLALSTNYMNQLQMDSHGAASKNASPAPTKSAAAAEKSTSATAKSAAAAEKSSPAPAKSASASAAAAAAQRSLPVPSPTPATSGGASHTPSLDIPNTPVDLEEAEFGSEDVHISSRGGSYDERNIMMNKIS
jgi:hypothetical protein